VEKELKQSDMVGQNTAEGLGKHNDHLITCKSLFTGARHRDSPLCNANKFGYGAWAKSSAKPLGF